VFTFLSSAMDNFSKDDAIPREREVVGRLRTYTWNNDSGRANTFHNNTPPGGMNRMNSMDGPIRIRTDSMSSERRSVIGMSPPVPILSRTPPSLAFSSPMCSTGTDSASSSYSVDYENNLNNNGHHHGSQPSGGGLVVSSAGPKSLEDEDASYVPWNPGENPQSLTLPLGLGDKSDYVETSINNSKESSSAAQTPSSYMEMQSPMSPYDNYVPMSPGILSLRIFIIS